MLVSVILGDTVERVEVPEEELLIFPRGVVGFEEFGRYALFELEHPLYLLQAVDDPHVGFLLLEPALVDPAYRVSLSRDDQVLLGLRSGESPDLLCIVTLSVDGRPASVNLRAPVAINPSRGMGAQIILQDSDYPMRHPLSVSADGNLLLDVCTAGGPAPEEKRRNGAHGRETAIC